jgi:hypothetical protein
MTGPLAARTAQFAQLQLATRPLNWDMEKNGAIPCTLRCRARLRFERVDLGISVEMTLLFTTSAYPFERSNVKCENAFDVLRTLRACVSSAVCTNTSCTCN